MTKNRLRNLNNFANFHQIQALAVPHPRNTFNGRREMARAERASTSGATYPRFDGARIRRLLRLGQVGEQLQATLVEDTTAFGQA